MDYQRSDCFGGTQGVEFSDDPVKIKRLKKINIRADWYVDSVQAVWELEDGTELVGQLHGGDGGELHTVELRPDEVINKITGRVGDYVDQLTFHTNKRKKFGPFGGPGGLSEFTLAKIELIGFFGKAVNYIDQIGFITKPSTPKKRTTAAKPKADAATPKTRRSKTEPTGGTRQKTTRAKAVTLTTEPSAKTGTKKPVQTTTTA